MITNFKIYDIEETCIASGYPKSVDLADSDQNTDSRINKLGKAPTGSGHDCFLKGIVCNMDVSGSLKWWAQFQRYHFADIVSSQSTMHSILKFDIRKMCNDWVDHDVITKLEHFIDCYNKAESESDSMREYWFNKIVYNIPSGFCLTARITTNLLQLKTIYEQRKIHKLFEWRCFIYELKKLIPLNLIKIIFKDN